VLLGVREGRLPMLLQCVSQAITAVDSATAAPSEACGLKLPVVVCVAPTGRGWGCCGASDCTDWPALQLLKLLRLLH
jgi:hypothetical protein